MKRNILLIAILLSVFSLSFAQRIDVTKGPMESQNFRGQRFAPTGSKETCKISQVTKNQAGQIDVYFTSPIDPKSVKAKNIYVNDKALSEDERLIFSRDCLQLRFTVNPKNYFISEKVNIRIDYAKNFQGQPLGTLRK